MDILKRYLQQIESKEGEMFLVKGPLLALQLPVIFGLTLPIIC
jgi:hypothetical protein